MHEISHNLAFAATTQLGMNLNRILSIIANLPLAIPAAIAFRKYHLDHHRYQGTDVLDVDLPTEWEGSFFRTPLRKVLWIFMQPLFYGLRPLVVNPKPLVDWELFNIVVQVTFDAFVLWMFGAKAFGYLLLSTLLGMGLHPTAYHFISEHFALAKGSTQETFSYYGGLNPIQYHVGYHNEHHDLYVGGEPMAEDLAHPPFLLCSPNIPGSRLHRVRAMAPEFYAIPAHTSWMQVFLEFILRADITPYSRVKRKQAL